MAETRYRGDVPTARGYALDEVISAVQKEIRRGNEVEAMYWATELIKSGYVKYLWNRLCVIASEDVGDTAVATLVNTLNVSYDTIAKRSKTSHTNVMVAHAILAMCRAKKTREVSNFQYWVMDFHYPTTDRDVPDYAVDGHTVRGRENGRTWDRDEGMRQFWEEGAIVRPERDEPDPYLPLVKNLQAPKAMSDAEIKRRRLSQNTLL